MSDENTDKPEEGKVEKTGEDNADENKNNAAEGAGEDAEAGEGENKEGDNSQDDSDKEPDVKPRKSVKDYIIERKEHKIKKLEEKLKSGEEDSDDEDDQGDDADDLSEEKIEKVISKRIAPLEEATRISVEKSLEAEDKAEAKEYVRLHPEFAPYQAKAEKFMKHPSRRQLPIESIFYEVAGKDLMKIGAARQKQADDDAKRSNAGGGTGGNEGAKSVKDMTPAEFAAYKEEIRSRRRE